MKQIFFAKASNPSDIFAEMQHINTIRPKYYMIPLWIKILIFIKNVEMVAGIIAALLIENDIFRPNYRVSIFVYYYH